MAPPPSALTQAAARLAVEFPDRAAVEVLSTVRRCRHDLAGVQPGALPELVERSARVRLRDRAR